MIGYLSEEMKELIGVEECKCFYATFTEGSNCHFVVDGKSISRKVRWSKAQGLHVKINGYAVSFDDFE